MREATTAKVGRALPDGQIQPLDVRSVQLLRILRGTPRPIPPPCRTGPGFPLDLDHTIIPSFLHDLTVQARSPKESSDNLTIELESVGRDQREVASRGPGEHSSRNKVSVLR